MRNSAAERLDAVASAEGGMTRLAFAWALGKGVDVDSLLRKLVCREFRLKTPTFGSASVVKLCFLTLWLKPLTTTFSDFTCPKILIFE
jgi:hypothetical protein